MLSVQHRSPDEFWTGVGGTCHCIIDLEYRRGSGPGTVEAKEADMWLYTVKSVDPYQSYAAPAATRTWRNPHIVPMASSGR
jgi:hypothetical protein